ncbi:MAG TPA: SLBB domain-containing protein [Gemmatimonadaceae bacterium]|nr:SLBB domain-containing protein [Gemmatimonadaceae bacterium]
MMMADRVVRRVRARTLMRFGLLCAAAVAARAMPVSAQQPTTQQAQQLLQSRKDLVAQLQARLQASGMTAEQVRARLKALGYPESLLDPYLQGAVPDSVATQTSDDVFRAATQLGLGVTTIPTVVPVPPPVRDDSALANRRGALRRDSSLTVFGSDVFQRNTSQFEPTEAGAADANYRVGARDVLLLIITGDVERAYSLDVTREGFVLIPQVGQVFVSNLTIAQITDVLFSRLSTQYSGVTRSPTARTKFSVSVARVRSNQVFVVGDVVAPASYQVSGLGTMLTALYAAGGPSESGTMRNVQLLRGGKLVSTLDVYNYLLRGDVATDLRLETGDVVFVPFNGKRVALTGEVGREAIYELKPTETLADLFQYAGGLKATAARNRIQISRVVPPELRRERGRDRVIVDVQTDTTQNAALPAFPLADLDSVYVYPISDRVRNKVTVTGSVWSAGPVALTPGMRVSAALRAAGGLRPDAYLGELHITRRMPDESRVQLRTSLATLNTNAADDLVLQEDDELRVFSKEEFRTPQHVAITGMVNRPGRYDFRQGMSLRDLIQIAGGLRIGAYLGNAEVARLPGDRTGGKLATTFRVSLDSSYLFDLADATRAAAARGQPFVLEPYDNVLILREPDWALLRTVVVTGEVKYPGVYALEGKNDRLADIVRRAGGLTTEAYEAGGAFIRRLDGIGRVDIDFPRALANPSSSENVRMEEGDSVNVPTFTPTVKVGGAVNSPSSISYRQGRNLKYYVDGAGGAARDADLSHAYVTQPNGAVEVYKHRFWLLPDGVPQPRPGAMVVVPAREKTTVDRERLYGSIAQVVASLAAVVIVALR